MKYIKKTTFTPSKLPNRSLRIEENLYNIWITTKNNYNQHAGNILSGVTHELETRLYRNEKWHDTQSDGIGSRSHIQVDTERKRVNIFVIVADSNHVREFLAIKKHEHNEHSRTNISKLNYIKKSHHWRVRWIRVIYGAINTLKRFIKILLHSTKGQENSFTEQVITDKTSIHTITERSRRYNFVKLYWNAKKNTWLQFTDALRNSRLSRPGVAN